MTSSMLCLRRETKPWQMPYEVLLTKALFFHHSKKIKREKPETSTAAFHLLQGKVSDVRPNIYKLYFGQGFIDILAILVSAHFNSVLSLTQLGALKMT